MPTRSKTFRIFVSSTFADMKAERNALQEHVLPKLQKLCEAHGCRFQAVDLRWGVSEEAALDQQTMNICLTELQRCRQVSPRPNFIILLGDRYGWMPMPPQIEASEFESIRSQVTDPKEQELLDGWYRLDTNAVPPECVLRARREDVPEEADYDSWGETERSMHAVLLEAVNRLGWAPNDKRLEKYECSATHQEIINGALDLPDEREHVFAFLRTIENIDALPSDSEFIDRTDDGVNKARSLKEDVKRIKGVTSFEYPVTWSGSEISSHIAQFTADALDSLMRVIEEELQRLEQIDDLTREDIAHEEFGAERCVSFVGREDTLERIGAYLRGGSGPPLVVYGPSGSGKSALMAKAALGAFGSHPDARILQRYVGATPESTDIRALLLNLCREITRAYSGDEATVPTDYKDLVEEFPKRLQLAGGKEPLILFIDALDQLSPSDNAHSLNWLPVGLPDNVKIVVSVLERTDDAGQCLRSSRSKLPTSALLRLEEMSVDDGAEAIGAWLAEANRGLTEDQWTNILFRFSFCPYPLYLKLAFEEARRWKSYEKPNELAVDIPGLINGMLARLSDRRQHGDVLVSTFLGLLSASRHGLSETEILELLSDDDNVMTDLRDRSARSPGTKSVPAVVWLRLYHDLAPYLMERSADRTSLYNFYHRQVDETVRAAYLKPWCHAQLARYFSDDEQRPLWLVEGNARKPNHRRCAELPFQQTESGVLWDDLVVTLTDLDFVDVKSKAGMVYDLVADYNRAERSLPEGRAEQVNVEERQARIAMYVKELIEHSSDPDKVPLPDPPETVPFQPPAGERNGDWTLLERVKAWGHFVGNHALRLNALEEPVFQIAWNSTDAGPVAERLQELQASGHGPSGCWLRLRNRPVFAAIPACLKKLEGHTDGVNAVSITPDGLRAVSGSEDKTLRVWDLATGASRALVGHRYNVSAVSITPDGRRAVSGSTDCTLRLWDLDTGVSRALVGHSNGVTAVSITPDGRRAVSGSWDNTLRGWDLETGASRVLMGHLDDVRAVSITPDGRRAVSGSGGRFESRDNTLRVWDLETGMSRVLEGHTSSVRAVSITPDGHWAVSGSEDNTLRVWNLETGVSRVLEGHTGSVLAVSLTPDGLRAVSGSSDNSLLVWDLRTGESRALEGHAYGISAVSLTSDGRLAVSGSLENTLLVWDLETGESRALHGHTKWVHAVRMTPDGQHAVSGSEDKTLRLWNLETGESRTLEGHTNYVRAVSLTSDGRLAVSGSTDHTLRVWNLETGASRALEGHMKDVNAVSITPDGRLAVSGSTDHTLRVWNLETGASRALEGHMKGVNAVSITPDGRLAVSGGEDSLRVWDLETGMSRALDGHTKRVRAVSLTPDGRLAVSGSDDCTLRVWDIETGVSRVLKGHTKWIHAVRMTPDGHRAVSGSGDDTLRVWDLATGASRALVGHRYNVSAVSITPDGRRAVSGSTDCTLRLWDLETGDCLVVCGMQSDINSISAHGLSLVAGESGGRVDMLNMENIGMDPAILTATRLWLFDQHAWDTRLTTQCCWCGARFEVKDEWVGQEVDCQTKGCGKRLKLNPFVCDPRDRPLLPPGD